jgi:CMP/dCMP kinase
LLSQIEGHVITEPEKGCFLCDPEWWRILYQGESVRIIAGLGPLCSGYVLLAPKEHIHTAAQLPDRILFEFLTTSEIIADALESQYGPGYTAYEHGQVGACRIKEMASDFSTFCHHCHRVFIPVRTDCENQLRDWFKEVHKLRDAVEIRHIGLTPYVYYESGIARDGSHRWAFTEDTGIPSQFMRQILTVALKTGRPYSWAADPRYAELVETAATLRGEFIGLDFIDQDSNARLSARPLSRPVTIDGFMAVGKTTVARVLAKNLNCQVLDSGMVWRWVAHQRVSGQKDLSAEALTASLTGGPCPELRRAELTPTLQSLSADPSVRESITQLIREAITSMPPLIVVGRDAWRIVQGSAHRFVLEADFATRVRRRALQISRQRAVVAELAAIAAELRAEDAGDLVKLPPLTESGCTFVNNGRRAMPATVGEILHHVEMQR